MARILVVDDSGLSRRSLRKMLESQGHRVTEAHDGFSALECYSVDRPDVVLLDLTMHGMHGMDVLSKMRQMDPEARIIVASADIQRATRVIAEDAGASAYINKPFSAEQVLETVKRVLDGRLQWN